MFYYLRVSPVKGTGGHVFIDKIVQNLITEGKRVILLDWTADYAVELEKFKPNVIKNCSCDSLGDKMDEKILQIICMYGYLNEDIKKAFDKEDCKIKEKYTFEEYRNFKVKKILESLNFSYEFYYVLEIKLSED